MTSTTVYDLDRDATYYADWKGVNRKVTFNSNGGTSVAQRNCENGSIIGKLPSTTLAGYNFMGWFTRKCDCGVEVSMFMPVLSDMTLYAHWEKMTYTVTFNPNNGQPSETIKVKYNDRLNYLPETPSKIGYGFKGWEANGTPVTESAVITSNLNVNAIWEAVRYEITYDIGGLGTVPASAKTEYTIESDKIVPPTPDAVTGYQFNGWTPVSIPKGSVGNKKFNGSWSVRKYTVTFNDNGGTSGTQTKTVEYMSTVGELPVSSRDGYDFDGWYTAMTGGDKIDESTVITGNATYYARWTAVVRNVYFDPCGGTVEDVEKTVTYNQEYGMLPTPYFNGHTFLGWYTTPSGGTRIMEDSIFENYIDTVVYAQWKTWKFTVSFNGNGNTSGSVSNQTFTFGIAQELR